MDKAALFTPRLTKRDVPLDVGTVRVRALSRDEMAEIREAFSDDDGELTDRKGFEYHLIATAMVDPADMSADDVEQWAKAAPGGELVTVLRAVNELSGLDDPEGKKSVPANRSERRAALRTRAGTRAG